MSGSALRQAQARGVALIAATYFYFLIFPQFGFLKLLGAAGVAGAGLKPIMGAMGGGGLAASLATPWLLSRICPERLLALAYLACAVAAAAATALSTFAGHVVAALGMGVGLGVATVTLVTRLRTFLGDQAWGWRIGLGTGLAYALCNVPAIFHAAGSTQGLAAAVAAGAAALLAGTHRPLVPGPPETTPAESTRTGFVRVLLLFTMLIAFDSAAFYLLQNSPDLASVTWKEPNQLWRNGTLHAVLALATGLVVRPRALAPLLAVAFGVLALAAYLLTQQPWLWWAGLIYPAGVSIYSVCLVAFPSYLGGEHSPRRAAWQAALLYGIAGWLGSGAGIGIVENALSIPWTVVAGTTAAFAGVLGWHYWRARWREAAVVSGLIVMTLAACWAAEFSVHRHRPPSNPAPVGLQVYLSEGCIHCHSQYVRPGTHDELLWGPALAPEPLRTNRPPLFGNRRHGPDLLQVGNRRSRAWLKEHFINPPGLSPDSVMPSYAHLFEDDRGEALLDYLTGLGRGTLMDRLAAVRTWTLPTGAVARASAPHGAALFAQHCANCHGAEGNGQGALSTRFPRPLGPLARGKLLFVPAGLPDERRVEFLARVIKFGLPGTQMPGHEYWPDSDLAAVAAYVADWQQSIGHEDSAGGRRSEAGAVH